MSEGVSVGFVTRVDWDTPISDDYEPRILPAAIELRERFNKNDPDHDSGDETTYQEIYRQIP
jgi:hypothetical protein